MKSSRLGALFTHCVEEVFSDVHVQDPAWPQSCVERYSYAQSRGICPSLYIINS